jgi:penicillin-binding protein 1B
MSRRAILPALTLAAVAAGAALTLGTVRHLDAVVVEKFNGRRWDFPSRIYSDAFLIYPGIDLEAAGFTDRLKRLNYRPVTSEPLRKGDYRRTDSGLDLFLRDFSYPGEHVDRLVHLELTGEVVVAMHDNARAWHCTRCSSNPS